MAAYGYNYRFPERHAETEAHVHEDGDIQRALDRWFLQLELRKAIQVRKIEG